MLYDFTFENYKSYRSEATLSLVAKPITEFSESLINCYEGTKKLLPVCAIYGPNGGGKSNVLMALRTLKICIIDPFQVAFMKNKSEKLSNNEMIEQSETVIKEKNEYFYKWDDVSKDKPTKFSILFQSEKTKYKYEINYQNQSIEEENLFVGNLENGEFVSVFERDSDGIYLCDQLKGIDIDNINSGLPLISYIAMIKDIDIIDNAVKYFLNIRVINFDIPMQDRRFHIEAIETDKKRIIGILNSMGIEISDFRVEKDSEGKVLDFYTKHEISGELKELKLQDESSGTRKMISMIPGILSGIDHGQLFIIDELDAKLHPKLLRKIVELFTNPSINKAGAQLIFTSHDITTMCKEVFRRDEIWFSAINGYNESVLYSLIDFKKQNNGDRPPRKDESYNKQYLEGRYGADPYMTNFVKWEEDECL